RFLKTLLHCINNGFESLRIVHRQIGQYRTVQPDIFGIQLTHQLRVGNPMRAGTSVDTLYPQRPKFPFFGLAVAISVQESVFYCVFSNGLPLAACSVLAVGHLDDLSASASGRYCVSRTWHTLAALGSRRRVCLGSHDA